MNSWLSTADCTTHLKIVVVSLVAALAVMTVGINAHVSSSGYAIAPISAGVTAGKAQKTAILADDGLCIADRG